jgi:hypothetical protein
MTFIEQRTKDDCQRCAVASIFSLQYEDVPDLSPSYLATVGKQQHWETVDFIKSRGLSYVEYYDNWAWQVREGKEIPSGARDLWNSRDVSGLSLGLGWSPRVKDGDGNPQGHAVVLNDGIVIWDPHPLRAMGIGAFYSYLIPTTQAGERLHL